MVLEPNRRTKRVLVVAYVFPPSGGAGVQRVTKFVRYLPEHGWDCSVLTPANPSVPVQDETLLDEIPESTVVRHAKTLEPGYRFKNAVSAGASTNRSKGSLKSLIKKAIRSAGNSVLHPDAQVLWYPHAVKEGKRLLQELHHDAIFVTAPPFSAFLVGRALSKFSGLPLILDYRDEWEISNRYQENRQRNVIANWIQRRQQRKVLKIARSVIATTQRSAESLRELVNESRSHATVSCIYNGYDQHDIDKSKLSGPAEARQTDGKFRLAYVGTLWNLTSIEPVVEAIRQIAATDHELVSRLELVIAGRRTGDQDAILDRLNDLPCLVKREGYVSHDRAIEIMNSADSLSLLLSNVAEAERVMPAKTFEYMALQKPILSISPPGEVTETIKGCPYADSFVPTDIASIANYLKAGLRGELATSEIAADDHWTPAQFERQSLCNQLSDVLDNACSASSREPDLFNSLQESKESTEGATL
jgi:glycosyltransferase involved in cell wall biosynthesis